MLEQEEKTYKELFPTLIKDEGRYALVCGSELKGTFATYENAIAQGYRQCGLTPFLVKKISAAETVLRRTVFHPL